MIRAMNMMHVVSDSSHTSRVKPVTTELSKDCKYWKT